MKRTLAAIAAFFILGAVCSAKERGPMSYAGAFAHPNTPAATPPSLGNPTPVVATDANGNVITVPGFSSTGSGSPLGNPTPVVLTDQNGLVLSLTGGSGGGNPSSANLIDVTASPYNVKADGYIFADGTTTNLSPTFSSASQSCSTADIGKLAIVVNATTGMYPFGTGLITVTGCNGSAWTLSGNASQSIAGVANWAMGSDATPGGTGGLAQAFQNAINVPPPPGKILAMPCGVLIITAPPFHYPTTLANTWNARPDVEGCNGTGATTLVLHPNISSGLLVNGGNLLFQYSPTSTSTGALAYLGLGGNAKISDLLITSIGGNIPGTAGKPFSIIDQFGIVRNIGMWGFSMSAGNVNAIQYTQGEAKSDNLNLQQFGLGSSAAAGYTGVLLQGQGMNGVSNSVFQGSALRPAISCNGGASCFVNGFYCSACGSGIISSGANNTITVVGATVNITSASNAAAIGDAGSTTWYIFGNSNLQNAFASVAPIQLGANSVLDMSGTKVVSLTAGFNISGPSTSKVNDRAGNSFSSALTQYSGQYIPIGGGSVATNSASAATNFGANLGATNIVTTSPGTATYDVKIGFRQVTLGVGCGAGSNTVNGVLSWTAGGVVQSTGAGGVPSLGTLTISANGTVGTSSAYSSVPVHADVNTAITFTTTSTLVSAGCSTVPQYVVDFSNI